MITARLFGFARALGARALATARVSAYLAFAFALAAALAARGARAELTESSLRFGRGIDRLGDLLGETKTVLVNGQRLHVSTAVVTLGVDAALDRFEQHCEEQPGPFAQTMATLWDGAHLGVDGSATRARLRLAVLRKSTARDGVLACFARGARPTADAPLEALRAFAATADLAALGDFRLVFARALEGGRTHVITTWSDGPLPIARMFPASGDAPGGDSPLAARPRDSRRILATQAEGAPYGARIYASTRTAAEAATAMEADMIARGWAKTEGAAGDASPRTLAFRHPSGVDAYVALTASDDGAIVSLLETRRAP